MEKMLASSLLLMLLLIGDDVLGLDHIDQLDHYKRQSSVFQGESNERSRRWGGMAYDVLQRMSCSSVTWTTEAACRAVQRTPRHLTAVWTALTQQDNRTSTPRFVARLPDGSLQRSGSHDGVVMLDPFPGASWGHLVLVLFADTNVTKVDCEEQQGHWIGSGECLTVATKERCRNLYERRGRRKNYERRCEISFPPLVLTEPEAHALQRDHLAYPESPPVQRLQCLNNIRGHAPCDQLRPLNDTNHLVCDPLGINSKRCSSAHETLHTRCRLFEVCDQAVIISGGFNRDLSPKSSLKTVQAMYGMLRKNGFHKANIKIFYANGQKKNAGSDFSHAVYPSSMKLGFRYHLRSVCAAPLCADSLVIYLTGPTMNDGTIMLWDEDSDGLLRSGEVYTPRELAKDLESCAARQVTILVDVSYSAEVIKPFKGSKKHKNVQVFASGGSEDYSWRTEFTSHWVHYAHTHSCTSQVYQASTFGVRLSSPTRWDGSEGRLQRTLFGAPCDVTPPFSWRELHHRYLGCQNTPTATWIRMVPSALRSPNPREITDEYFLPGALDFPDY